MNFLSFFSHLKSYSCASASGFSLYSSRSRTLSCWVSEIRCQILFPSSTILSGATLWWRLMLLNEEIAKAFHAVLVERKLKWSLGMTAFSVTACDIFFLDWFLKQGGYWTVTITYMQQIHLNQFVLLRTFIESRHQTLSE